MTQHSEAPTATQSTLAVLWLAVSPEGVSTAQLQLYTGPLGGRRIPRAVELRVLPGWGLGLGLGWVGVGVKVRVRARVRVEGY